MNTAQSTQGPTQYRLLTQINATCDLHPWMNFQRVMDGPDALQDSACSKRDSIGESFLAVHSFSQWNQQLMEKQGHFAQWFNTFATTEAICSNDRFIKTTFHGIKPLNKRSVLKCSIVNQETAETTPYHFTRPGKDAQTHEDIDSMSNEHYLPFLQDKDGKFKFYNLEQKAYVELQTLGEPGDFSAVWDVCYKADQKAQKDTETGDRVIMVWCGTYENDQYQAVVIPKWVCTQYELTIDELKGCRFDFSGKLGTKVLYTVNSGLILPAAGDYDEGKFKPTHFAFEFGLLQFMLFTMGVDRNGNPITEDHEAYEACQELQQSMKSFDHHPWNVAHFKKENLFEWQLAQVLKADKALAAQARVLIHSLFRNFKSHRELGNLQDAQGKKLSDRRASLLSDELMDATFLSRYLYALWGAAKRASVGFSMLEVDGAFERWMSKHLLGILGPNKLVKRAKQIFKRGKDRFSLISFFQQVFPKIWANANRQRTFVSFHGHGSVVTWDPRWQALQKQQGMERPGLAKDLLDVVVLDSCYEAVVAHAI